SGAPAPRRVATSILDQYRVQYDGKYLSVSCKGFISALRRGRGGVRPLELLRSYCLTATTKTPTLDILMAVVMETGHSTAF
ncbi:hypothetical protein AVEN_178963-1, partial [Araneus ventricosus]